MKNPAKFTSLAVLCMAVLTACGGGGDDATPVAAAPTPPPVSVNPAPGIGPAPVTPAPPAAVVTPPPPPPVVVTPPPPPVVVTPPPPPPVVVTPPPPPPVVVTPPPPPPPVVVTPPPPPPVVVTPPPPAAGTTAPGNPDGNAAVPSAGQAVNTSSPARVVGTGTAASCTSAAVVTAVAQGGIITFNCGAAPVTITMTSTAKVFNDKPDVTLDGGGKVTLDGGGNTRILYQNTCDSAQVFTSSRCDLQTTPTLTVQNLTFSNGNSSGKASLEDNSGGAISVFGGQFKIVNSRFINNRCEGTGPDNGGGAVRARNLNLTTYVVNSTFGGAPGLGNICSNGGALSGLGVSFSIYNSLFTHNEAIGRGANPARAGTPGGGNGGAIYSDGNTFKLEIVGSAMRDNKANEGGGAVFFVSNDRSGSLSLVNSTFARNPSLGFETAGFPGFFFLAAPGQPLSSGSTFSR